MNQDKLPCKLGDRVCWDTWLVDNHPCDAGDDACFKSFDEHYDRNTGGADVTQEKGMETMDQTVIMLTGTVLIAGVQ